MENITHITKQVENRVMLYVRLFWQHPFNLMPSISSEIDEVS